LEKRKSRNLPVKGREQTSAKKRGKEKSGKKNERRTEGHGDDRRQKRHSGVNYSGDSKKQQGGRV